jgi:hypothetical protein
MARSPRRPSGIAMGLGVAAVALWPSCGGKSVRFEGDPDDPSEQGASGFGADTGGGVSGNGVGGVSFPQGGVGNAPNGGNGVGARPAGGRGAFGGVGGFAAAGFGGGASAGFAGQGLGMGGRFGGFGGGFGGRGFGGRGFGGFGGVGGTGKGGAASNPLDGFTFLVPCAPSQPTPTSCLMVSMGCASNEPTLPGFHPTDRTVTMPGVPGVFYDWTIRFQGVLDSKSYAGGVDQDDSIVDGFYTGGAPVSDNGTIYLVRVGSPARDYFLNSLSPTSGTQAEAFYVDYRAVIRAEGGTIIRLVSADGDCTILRNCGDNMNPNSCVSITVGNLLPGIADDLGGQPYDGQFIGMVVEAVAIVP